MGMKALFCANFGHSLGDFPICRNTWCGSCYRSHSCDQFHINHLLDEDGNDIYDCPSDRDRYKIGVDGAQFLITFQCDICIFRLLFRRDPSYTSFDIGHLHVIRRLNLDAIWSREPSTIKANLRSLAKLISTCETAGIKPNIPLLGPLPFKDNFGYFIAFSMLVHSRNPGKHSKLYTQFATIRKQRSSFSNLYMASREASDDPSVINFSISGSGTISNCLTNSIWFKRWSSGCKTRMGFILKQNKAININLLKSLISSFHLNLQRFDFESVESWRAISGLTYSIISFFASLRGNEGLKVHHPTLLKYWNKGSKNTTFIHPKSKPITPHVIIPIYGRFKGEQGKRSHLLVLANITASGVKIHRTVELFLKFRALHNIHSVWLFTDLNGNKMSFDDMNEIVLNQLDNIKYNDSENNIFDLQNIDIREEYSINRSFCRGSSSSAQLLQIPTDIIELVNRWKKIKRSKGRKPKFSMLETYADIEILIPKLVQYSARL